MQGASASMSRVFRPGTPLGRYTIVERIGCGGMAELYLARAQGVGGFEKALALKVIHAHRVQEASAVRMFLREARLAATLDHPNIVQVLDVGVFDGEHALVMEYIHGKDVGQILSRLPAGQGLPLGCAFRVFIEVCNALDYAHHKSDANGVALGLVHRDVSPANVLVGFNGAVKLTDFGIAKISAQPSTTETGALKGKFGYMSPEQSLGQPVDARSDIFAMGVLLYEMTTGCRAFIGDNAFVIMNAVIEGEYVPAREVKPGYPEELERIIARALQPEPEARYESVAAMGRDVEAFASKTGLMADGPALGKLVRDVFGEVPYPNVSVSLPRMAGESAATLRGPDTAVDRSRRRARSAQISLITALALTVGGAIGWYAASDARPPVSQPAEPSSASKAEGAVVVVPVATPPNVDEGEAPTDERPEPPGADDESSTDETDPPSRSKVKRGRKPKRRPKRRSTKQSSNRSGDDLDSMFPTSMR